jgi:hypothetical protein
MARLEIVYDDKLMFDGHVDELKFGQSRDTVELAAAIATTTPAPEGPPGDADDTPDPLGETMPGWEEGDDDERDTAARH